MNYTQLVNDLTKQIEKLTAARDALRALGNGNPVHKPGTITPAGRARIAAAQRARHAKAKKEKHGTK